MGGNSSKGINYAEWLGDARPGETRILRHPDYVNKELLIEQSKGINTIWKAFEYSVNANGNRPFLGTRKFISKEKSGDFIFKSYLEIYNEVKDFASCLISLNLCPKVESLNNGPFKFMGIYSKNREEWLVADLACHLIGATVVTFYDTLGENTIEYILDQTKLTTIVMESKSLKKLITLKKSNGHGNLENIILLDVESEEILNQATEAGFKIFKYPEVLNTGKTQKVEFSPSTPETIATFCYTSGTTGIPKGAMISHKGLLADISALINTDLDIKSTDIHLSYLPLAHIMERAVVTACMLNAVAIGFYQGNPAKLLEDAQLLKPTIFIAVPRIFQRVYEVITTGMSKLGSFKKSLADKAVNSKLQDYRKNGSLTHSIWDRLVFKKSKEALGGRVRIMLTGSAPIEPKILEFLKICFCCPIIEGYGQTETCAGATITKANDFKIGHVGGPIPSIELKLIDCEGLNYKSTDVDEKGNLAPRGEICFRGNSLFSGYFNDLQNTKATVDQEGWLHTGDVGIILPDHGNALKIIDRVKNIFKLSHGEYVAPEKLENILVKTKYVQQIFIYGESLENYVVALVVPREETIVKFLKAIGVDANKDNIREHFDHDQLIKEILKDMETFGRDNDFKGFEIIKKIHLLREPFTIENDLLTPTMKLKRNEVKSRYLDILKKLYC